MLTISFFNLFFAPRKPPQLFITIHTIPYFRAIDIALLSQRSGVDPTDWSGLRGSVAAHGRRFGRRRLSTVPRTVDSLPPLFEPLSCFLHNQSHPDGWLWLWSGLRDSNPPHRPWEGRALPDELNPHMCILSHWHKRCQYYSQDIIRHKIARTKRNGFIKPCRGVI